MPEFDFRSLNLKSKKTIEKIPNKSEDILTDIKPVEKVEIPKIEKKVTSTGKVTGSKTLDKEHTIAYIINILASNEKAFTLDFLRGQKLVYDALIENRKSE